MNPIFTTLLECLNNNPVFIFKDIESYINKFLISIIEEDGPKVVREYYAIRITPFLKITIESVLKVGIL